jgi:hypothetical protein
MSVEFNAYNAVWGDDLISISKDEPYIYLDNITFWFNKENDFTLIKPVEMFNIEKNFTKI